MGSKDETRDLDPIGGVEPSGDLSLSAQLERALGDDTCPTVSLDDAPEPPAQPVAGLLERLSLHRAHTSRYRVFGELARGGMGSILRVWDGDLRRELAMKVILSAPGSQAPSARKVGRFLEEAQVTGQLSHPGIVPLHELGLDEGGRVYFTMRLVRGCDLRAIFELVRERADGWSVTRALGVVLRVCEAMAYAHSKGVIHRDLKPANVMVGRFGEVYVMDWGLAKVAGRPDSDETQAALDATRSLLEVETDRHSALEESPDSPAATRSGAILGTPVYMSPEQAQGMLDQIGPHSDVYALGAMLYELVTGRIPYVQPGAHLQTATVLALIIHGPPTPVHELAPLVAPELVAICEKAMARTPRERYASMAELADDLRAYLENRVVRAFEVGAVAELRKWVRRNRGWAATIVVAALLVLATVSTSALVLAKKNLALGRRSAQVLELADVKRLRDLEQEADELWPALPENAGLYRDFLARADELVGRVELHRRTLVETQARGEASVRSELGAVEGTWLCDTLQALIDDLENFEATLVPDVERRLEFALRVEELTRSGERARADWEDAARSIEADPVYGGLVLAPQLGLLPIGRNPRSGLWEFVHLASSAWESAIVPEHAPDGWLELSADTGVVLVLLPGGRFEMGAERPAAGWPAGSPHADPDALPSEAPIETIELAPFFVSRYELTQAQWQRATGVNPSRYGESARALHPVEWVTWGECASVLSRLGLALPSEAQWEYAARGGTTTVWWTGNDAASLVGAASLADRTAREVLGAPWREIDEWPGVDDGYAVHAPVDALLPNPFGLYGVVGNVREWCLDAYGRYGHEPVAAGTGERAGLFDDSAHIFRGGSFRHGPASARSACRLWEDAERRENFLGVRPARLLGR